MQAQHEVKTGSENQENAATDWDKLGEEIAFDPDAAEKLIQEVKNEQSAGEENAEDDTLEIVETQPAQPEEITLTPEVEKEETKEFCGLQLTKSELAEDKIIVNCGIKYRGEKDRIGRALDIKRAERLLIKSLDAGGDEYGDKYIKKLTPHMIGSLIDWFNSDKSFEKPLGGNAYPQAQLFKAFFEKVPLEAQAELAATQGGSNMLKEAEGLYSYDEDEKNRLRVKGFSGLAKNIKDGVLTRGEVSMINRRILAGAAGAKRSLFEGFRSDLASGFVDVVLSSERHGQFKNDKVDVVSLAAIAPDDVRSQCIEKVLEKTDGLDAVQVACLRKNGYEGDIPGGSGLERVASVAASIDADLFAEIAPRLKDIDVGSLDNILTFCQQRAILRSDVNPEAKVSESDLFWGISKIRPDKIGGLCEKLNNISGDLSKDQIKNLADFLVYQDEYKKYSPDIIESVDLEHIPSLNGLCKQRIQELLSKGGDYREARSMLFERALGWRAGEATKDLVSFGVIELPKKYASGGKLKAPGDEFGQNIASFYEVSEAWNPTSVGIDSLAELAEKGYISKADEMMVAAVGSMLCSGAEGVSKNLFLLDERSDGESNAAKFTEAMDKIRKTLREQSGAMYTEYMKEGIEKGAVLLEGAVRYKCGDKPSEEERELGEVETPVYEMRGDEFMFFVHKLGAFNPSIDKDNPAQWDKAPDKFADDDKTKPLGYISTTAICNGALGLAAAEKGKNYDKDEDVLYGFSEIPPNGFLYSSEYDLYTHDSQEGADGLETGTLMQDFFYKSPRKIIERMKEYFAIGGGRYNEIVLNRFPGIEDLKDGRMRPNYVIVYGKSKDDISNRVKKQAAYFGVPIMLINPDKYK
ncbi:hypothetical protein IK110_03620 [Candidatus Saccharibacteria bacterium]|nr:hypothetical protein [Candidatus Saccharibacteria bacterium]